MSEPETMSEPTPPQATTDVWGLVWTLVRTDFKVRYHGTIMGFFWALMKPTAMFLVLMAVFSLIFAADAHYKLNLIIGLFLWEFFAEGTKVGLTALAAKGYLLAKTRLPRWILIVTAPANALITLLVVAGALLVTITLIGTPPSLVNLGLFLLFLVELVVIVIGFSLATSPLFLRYRDLNQVWDVVVHAGFFLAPIVYPLRIMPERYHFYLYVWPPTPIIQFARSVLVEGSAPTGKALALLGGVTVFVFVVGVLLYRRFGPSAAEHL
jgi:ABC-type polysaccharide/polyol phosphate export permease